MEVNFPDHIKGDTFNGYNFQVFQSDGTTPQNLTGVTIRCAFRERSKTSPVVRTILIGSGITVTDAAQGLFKVDADIYDFKAGDVYYDFEFKFTDNTIKTLITGVWKIIQDVTPTT